MRGYNKIQTPTERGTIMKKTYIYNFNGTILESYGEAFPDAYYALKREATANGDPISRQIVYPNGKIVNERFHPAGIWLPEE
jgi:hypothetical protein